MPLGTGDLVRVSPVFSVSAVAVQMNVYHVVLSQGTSGGTDAEYRVAIQDWIQATYLPVQPHISNLLTGLRIDLYNETDDVGEAPVNFNPAWGGGGASELLPAGVAGFVWFRTAAKRRQGRKYLPSFTEAANGVGAWVAAVYTAMGTFAGQLLNPFTASNGAQVDFRIRNSLTGAAMIPLSYGVGTDARYQRRRRAGVGS